LNLTQERERLIREFTILDKIKTKKEVIIRLANNLEVSILNKDPIVLNQIKLVRAEEVDMGKLKDLIQEYLRAPKGSSLETEIASEIEKISEWMIEKGYTDKPVQLPKKNRRFKFTYGIGPNVYNNGFAFYNHDFCSDCGLCLLPLETVSGNVLSIGDCSNAY